MEDAYEKLSKQSYNPTLRKAPRPSDFSTVFDVDPIQFVRGPPLLRM